MSVSRYAHLAQGYVISMDFRSRVDADVCLNLDGTDYRSGYKMRLYRVKRFVEEWNKEIDKSKNPFTTLVSGKSTSDTKSKGEKF